MLKHCTVCAADSRTETNRDLLRHYRATEASLGRYYTDLYNGRFESLRRLARQTRVIDARISDTDLAAAAAAAAAQSISGLRH